MNEQRLQSLDVFRGITIAGMILVNNPGSWSAVYPPLLHADWHGSTPTDWIFPFFLFIMGVAIPFSLGRRREQAVPAGQLIRKVAVRTLVIFGLGLFLAGFPHFGFREAQPAGIKTVLYVLLGLATLSIFMRGILQQKRFNDPVNAQRRRILGYIALGLTIAMIALGWGHYDLSNLRIPGVLQRIALVYLFCALLFLYTPVRTHYWITAALLLGYWVLMTLVPVPGYGTASLEPESNLGAWFDRLVLGTNHLWSQSKTWDPEGLLSTLPVIGTGMLGVFAGQWLRTDKEAFQKISGLLLAGTLLLAVSLTWDVFFPINKKIWTSSYVLYTGGIATLFLGLCYWAIDVMGWKRWAYPFKVFGLNALFVYVLSGLVAKMMYMIQWPAADGGTTSLQSLVYHNAYLQIWSGKAASLAYAIGFVLSMYVANLILYRNRIYIKV